MGWFSSAVNKVGGGQLTGMIPGMDTQIDQWTGGGAMDMIPGIGDARAAEKQNKEAARQAELNRQFQARMSNTAYQRAMADMSAAGLNPMLAFTQGGASSPSGAVADVQSTSKSKLGDFAFQAATGLGSLRNQTNATNSQAAVNESAVKLNAANSANQIANAEKTRVETVKARKDIPRAELEEKLSRKASQGIEKALNTFEHSAKSIVPKSSVNPKTLKYESPVRSLINRYNNFMERKFGK